MENRELKALGAAGRVAAGAAYTGYRRLPRRRWEALVTADSYGACWDELLRLPAPPGASELVVRTKGGRP
jgi:hypothetical protein